MKSKFKLLASCGITVAAAGMVVAFAPNTASITSFTRTNRSINFDYSITLNADNKTFSDGTYTRYTDQYHNPVEFVYSGVGEYVSGHVTLNEGGKIVNAYQLTSITMIDATFSGELLVRTSLDYETWSEYFTLTSGSPRMIEDSPYFIEVKASTSTTVTSIKYTYTCVGNPDAGVPESVKEEALKDIRAAFNKLDIDAYAKSKWKEMVTTLNNATTNINNAGTIYGVQTIRDETIAYFASVQTQAEAVAGTYFDYIDSKSNYEYSRDDQNHLVITYDGYPGHWVHGGTKSISFEPTVKNYFYIEFSNDINEDIEFCLQLTGPNNYKVDSGIVSVPANSVKTYKADFDERVTAVYFFLDSCSVHNRKGHVTILDAQFKYEKRGTDIPTEPKEIAVNQPMAVEDGSATIHTLLDTDKPKYIERISVMIAVDFHGNGSSKQWYGLHLYAGSKHASFADSAVHAQTTETGNNIWYSYEIDADHKLSVGQNVYCDVSYCADGLTFEVIKYIFHYGEWANRDSETVNVNHTIYDYSSGSNTATKAVVPYSSFEKKGKVKQVDITFTTVNEASYGKSQIYLGHGLTFTGFPSGNNNVLNIGSIMDKSTTTPKTGTMTIYPEAAVDLTEDSNFEIECWWASATTIRVDSITLYTEIARIPDDVTGLEAHPIDSGVVLNWNASEEAISYVVYCDNVLVKNVNNTFVTVDGLTNGQEYTFKVVATNLTGSSDGVTIKATPVEGATYDTFIEGLNSSLEQSIGDSGMADLLAQSSSYLQFANNARLKNVISKMQAGEKTTIAFMGGSITVGEGADIKVDSKHRKGYAYYTYEWLKNNYDTSGQAEYVSAAISGTDSEIGLVRAKKDVFDHNPDLIFIEFAANNGSTTFDKQSYESLIRNCMNQPQDPAIMLVFSATYYSNDTSGTEKYMADIGKYYNLPMYSIHKGMAAVCTEMKKTDLGGGEFSLSDETFAAYTKDGTHPNDNGHKLMGKGLAYSLRTLINKETDTKNTYPADPSKNGYDKYEGLVSVDNTNATSIVTSLGSFVATNTATSSTSQQSDVTAFQQGWKKTDTYANDAMVIEVTAKNFILVYASGNKSVATDPVGNVIVTYTNKNDSTDTGSISWDVRKTCKINEDGTIKVNGDGWQNSCAIRIFDKAVAGEYIITIQMEEATPSEHNPGGFGRCTIMAFGYTA